PTRECVDVNVCLIPGGDGNWSAVPFQEALVETVHACTNGILKCRPGSVIGSPTGCPNCVMITCSVCPPYRRHRKELGTAQGGGRNPPLREGYSFSLLPALPGLG